MEEEPGTTSYKAGYVAVMGRPNVGKSTLINKMLDQKIAAVSPRPQTTRKRQLGILTLEDAQVVFVDTPGVHKPLHKLGESMNQEAIETLDESDIALFLVDASQEPNEEDRMLAGFLKKLKHPIPTILALNKTDLWDKAEANEYTGAYQELIPEAQPVAISALEGTGLGQLTEKIIALLPAGDPFYPEGQVTDLYEKDLAADLIREAALNILRDEVPHGVAIRIDQYQERGETGAYIEATLFVEKESHKGIVIGEGGTMLKKIGSYARKEIEAMSGRKVFLRLRVKVRKNWRDDERVLRWFGF
jgi:GTP-binding protein Era